MPTQFVALNTDFVLAIAAGYCEAGIDVLGKLGFHFLVSPVVEESLYDIYLEGRYDESKRIAAETHSRLASFGVLTPSLDGMGRFYTRETAEKWLNDQLCQGCYFNDYLAVTEASHLGAKILLTARPVLHCQEAINKALFAASLDALRIVNMMDFNS
ncbi:MAG: hypothetical protein ACREIW_12610 [Chthoniobacterales bacterium]